MSREYEIIYADPPWRYEKQLRWESKKIFGLEEKYYQTMDIEEIKNMKVPGARDSWLILWTTVPKLQEGLDVLKAWGYEYRTSAIWDKGNGLGFFFRIYHEIILIGKKGNPKNPLYSEKSIFEERRTKHSKKPQKVYRWIEKAFPGMSKLELFARPDLPLFPKRDNWHTWGNELQNDVELSE